MRQQQFQTVKLTVVTLVPIGRACGRSLHIAKQKSASDRIRYVVSDSRAVPGLLAIMKKAAVNRKSGRFADIQALVQ